MENNDDYVLVLSYDAYAQLRIANGYKNDSEVAKLSGVTTSTISGWKTGGRKPCTENLMKLAACLKVPMEAFYVKVPKNEANAEAVPAGKKTKAASVKGAAKAAPQPSTDIADAASPENLSERARLIAAAYNSADWVTRALIDRVIDTRPA